MVWCSGAVVQSCPARGSAAGGDALLEPFWPTGGGTLIRSVADRVDDGGSSVADRFSGRSPQNPGKSLGRRVSARPNGWVSFRRNAPLDCFRESRAASNLGCLESSSKQNCIFWVPTNSSILNNASRSGHLHLPSWSPPLTRPWMHPWLLGRNGCGLLPGPRGLSMTKANPEDLGLKGTFTGHPSLWG